MISDLRQPNYDDETDFLPSFASIRRRTMDTLYPKNDKNDKLQRPDKSPKGSVDAPIQRLVDLLNQHPSFATLSSCSGRISLFDPELKKEKSKPIVDVAGVEDDDETTWPEERVNSGGDSGKGGFGGWLLASHDVIEPCQLLDLLPGHHRCSTDDSQDDDDDGIAGSLLTFKFEPMLLHVAAATLDRGQQLLQIVLRLGFRESGLVVTKSRVTVAIRSYSLALNVPLTRGGHLRPPDSYLTGLVEEANRRLMVNLSRIDLLHHEIARSLFHRQQPRSSICTIHAGRLPDLNLWGRASVAVVDEQENASILSFGGYGEGPELSGQSGVPRSCKRSDAIYQLQRHGGIWDSCWKRLEPVNDKWEIAACRDVNLGILVEGARFSSREGAACCVLASPKGGDVSLISVFGGRKSPAHPLDDLLLCEYSSCGLAVGKAVDVRGDLPGPRWGHSFTALSGSPGRRIAVLYGGRNETTVHDSIHVLSLVDNDTSECNHLLWESLVTASPTPPRFHHACIIADDSQDQVLVVFGGLSTANDLLDSFSSNPFDSTECLGSADAFSIDLADPPPAQVQRVLVEDVNDNSNSVWNHRRFGHRASLVIAMGSGGGDRSDSPVESPPHMLVALSGGVPITTTASSDQSEAENAGLSAPIELFQVRRSRTTHNKHGRNSSSTITTGSPYPFEWAESVEPVDFGSLVHHNACVLPLSNNNNNGGGGIGCNHSSCLELVLTGGGVLGFGFRPCFAKSYALTIAFASSSEKASSSSMAADAAATSTTTISKKNEHNKTGKNNSSSYHNHKPPVVGLGISDGVAVPVVYVHKQNAKTLKTLLEQLGWLDKRHRMAPATVTAEAATIPSTATTGSTTATTGDSDTNSGNVEETISGTMIIAVPVTTACLEELVLEERQQQEQHSEKEGGGDASTVAAAASATTPAPSEGTTTTTTTQWKTLVLGRGKQELPRSTATYAKQQPSFSSKKK